PDPYGPDISRLQRTFLTDETHLVPGIVLPTRRRVVLADHGRLLRSRPLPPQRRLTGDRQSNLPGAGPRIVSRDPSDVRILPSLNGSARTQLSRSSSAAEGGLRNFRCRRPRV